MREMTEKEWPEFLRAGTRTAKLATVRTNGRPTVTPIWFLYESDGVIRIETGAASAKVKALRRDPRASLVVDLEEPPYGYVRVGRHRNIRRRPGRGLSRRRGRRSPLHG